MSILTYLKQSKERAAKQIKRPKVWLWMIIGIIAGAFAFGFIGAILGMICGIYLGRYVK